ncbi:ABC transporter permease [Chachezhania antarctica]|uniref:ABC transporter permease n=1 Tax=Chachezhania antarctica TaxID=2340860 RepID=UPI000EB1B929|nr:ABC transporter permease [Chachezhania antarctica]
MADATADQAETQSGPMLAADGTPLKRSLARSLRMQRIRALMLVAPLLIFVLLTFLSPIFDMLFRAVENRIVGDTLPRTVEVLKDWDPETSDVPPEAAFQALYYDLFLAAEAKKHTRLGTRLNYEDPGISSLFRSSGRSLDDLGEDHIEAIEDTAKQDWREGAFWYALLGGDAGEPVVESARSQFVALEGETPRGPVGVVWCGLRNVVGAPCPPSLSRMPLNFGLSNDAMAMLPTTSLQYAAFGVFTVLEDGEALQEEDPWEAVYVAMAQDLAAPDAAAKVAAYTGPGAAELQAAQQAIAALPPISFRDGFAEIDEDWLDPTVWRSIKAYSPKYTPGYFLNAVDLEMGPDGVQARPESQQIYVMLFKRTLIMSMAITISCIMLGYPVAWLLSNLPDRKANMLMILVLLPFWTSLLVRTSAWKVMLQQQGVINDTLVWLGIVSDTNRLVMINNQFGTIVAMTHILLPFMILPLYSVMKGIPPSYLRAAKSLGANNWTAFWRVYFPQSVPGIGAGSILVFILAIGYYITPELVGGTTGTFISNRIAYHISSSLNWGLAAALGSILLVAVLVLYWAYDRIVGIDNVKLGG